MGSTCDGGEREEMRVVRVNRHIYGFDKDDRIFSYCTERVKAKQATLEPVQPRTETPDVVLRPCHQIEGGAWYDGEVDKRTEERNGFGVQVWKNGSCYEGEWRNDRANGYGRLIHPDGEYYEGEFSNDKASGRGQFHYNDETIYKGDFENNKPNGRGREIYPDGSEFSGDF